MQMEIRAGGDILIIRRNKLSQKPIKEIGFTA